MLKCYRAYGLGQFIVAMILTMASVPGAAQIVALDEGQTIYDKRSGWLPYAFSTDSLGTGIGIGGFVSGNFQPQASIFGTGLVTNNDSALVSGAMNNFRFGDSRFFWDAFVLADHFTDERFYVDVDFDPTRPRAGSNDSDKDDFVSGTSNELTFEYTVKYPLPIGGARDNPIGIYHLKRGLLEEGPPGALEWNPMTSGRTTLAAHFFYTYRDLSDFGSVDEDEPEARTNGLAFWIEYDNTDFHRNPSRGSRQQFKVTRDFG
jgi:hypothetical protein